MAINQRNKDTYPGLFESGFTDVEFDNIDTVFSVLDGTHQRSFLVSQLKMFIRHLQSLGLRGDLWVNGSFSTRNPNPMDYDVLLVIPRIIIATLDPENKKVVDELTDPNNHDYVRRRWGCDLYVCESSNLAMRRFYEELFSNNPDQSNKKGIAVIRI